MPWLIRKSERQRAEYRGRLAEQYTLWHLRLRGYKIIHQRYRCFYGEIDLIAQRNNHLIAIEVKYRKLLDTALFSISPSQQRRIEQSLLYFQSLDANKARLQMRFDVVCVYGIKLSHLKNAWFSKSF